MSPAKTSFLLTLGIYSVLIFIVLSVQDLFVFQKEQVITDSRVTLMGYAILEKLNSTQEQSQQEEEKKEKQAERKEIKQEVKKTKKIPSKNNVQSTQKKQDNSTQEQAKTINAESGTNREKSLQGGISSEEKAEFDAYYQRIRKIIFEKYFYPASLQQRRIKGEVTLGFKITKEGQLREVKILKSSQKTALDNLAIRTLESAESRFPKPKKEYFMKVTLVY